MTQIPYQVRFPVGTTVQIATIETLEEFRRTWKYHTKLQLQQIEHHGMKAVVEQVGAYHGGDMLYKLRGIPGAWHECCLSAVESAGPPG